MGLFSCFFACQSWINYKMSTDPAWQQGCEVIFSGSEVSTGKELSSGKEWSLFRFHVVPVRLSGRL